MSLRVIIIGYWISCIWGLPSNDHGIYISVFEIEHNTELEEGQVIIKTFSDDLANALRSMNFNIPQDIDACKEEDAIKAYVAHHFSLRINDSEMQLQLNDCQIENDTHWIYLGYKADQELIEVAVDSDWLTELFVTQQNIIKLRSGSIQSNARLTKDKTLAEFNF